MHLTCNTVINFPDFDTLDATIVLASSIPRGGIYSRLRVLKITGVGLGSPERPFILGDVFAALDVLYIHALTSVELEFEGEGLRPRVLDLQCGGALDVCMPNPRRFASRLEQLHMRSSVHGRDLAEVLRCMAANAEVLRGEPSEYEIWCPPCSEERMADLLGCGCGACMACLRREGKLVL